MEEADGIRFTASDKENHIRSRGLTSVAWIEPDFFARLDNGKIVNLDAEATRHIDYGYAVETVGNLSAGCVILSGEVPQLADLEDNLVCLNPSICRLSIYTSKMSQTLQVELAQSGVTAGTLSKQLAKVASLGIAEYSLVVTMIEDNSVTSLSRICTQPNAILACHKCL